MGGVDYVYGPIKGYWGWSPIEPLYLQLGEVGSDVCSSSGGLSLGRKLTHLETRKQPTKRI